jgi:hypothetical protein
VEENRSIVERYLAALPSDLNTLTSLHHQDYVEEWPQSGERIRGSENFRRIQERYVETSSDVDRVVGTEDRWTMAPTLTPIRIFGAGDTFTAITKARYPDAGDYHAVSIIELRDGLIWRVTTFFAAPFEAPDWRAPWVERMVAQAEAEG